MGISVPGIVGGTIGLFHTSPARRLEVGVGAGMRDLADHCESQPTESNRKLKPCFSKRLYRERNLIERFFSKLEHFRRIDTRYDKLAANFLAMVQLASMWLWLWLWLWAYEPTA